MDRAKIKTPLQLCAGGWVSEARRCPTVNFNNRPEGAVVSLLVVHNISLPPGQFGGGYIEQFFANQLDTQQHSYFATIAELQVSAHFLIDRTGLLTQFVATEQRAWHAGLSSFEGCDNCNDYSIGIELEGCDELPYSENQYATLAEITELLLRCYPAIGVERIVGHSDIAPGRKTDPGRNFDWRYYRSLLTASGV